MTVGGEGGRIWVSEGIVLVGFASKTRFLVFWGRKWLLLALDRAMGDSKRCATLGHVAAWEFPNGWE